METLLALAALVIAFLAYRSARRTDRATASLQAEIDSLRRQLAAGGTRPGAAQVGTGQAVATPAAGPPAQGSPAQGPIPAAAAQVTVPPRGLGATAPVSGASGQALGAPPPLPAAAMSAGGAGVAAGTQGAPPPAARPLPPGPWAASRAAAAPAGPAPSLEERLGARLPVWIGSIALALAGAFLVKHSLDQGWLSPPVRVGFGLAFGVAMLAAGEGLRRSSARVSQGLSAAGIADLFACLLAAVQLYHLIPPALGFALMAVVTALAVVLSLRQGAIVALIGLVGGFLAPAWIQVGEPDARNLFAYLLLLEAGLLAVSRRRGWAGIALLSTGAGLVWALAWMLGPFRPGDAVWLDLFLIATAGAAATAALAGETPWEERSSSVLLAGGTSVLALLAAAQLARQTGNSPAQWGCFALISAGLLVLGRIDAGLSGLSWIASGVGAAMLLGWESAGGEPERRLATALGVGALFAVGGYLAAVVLPRRGSPRPGLWMSLSAASGIVYFLIAYATAQSRPAGIRWGVLAIGLAAVYALASAGFLRARERAAGAAESAAQTGTDSALAAAVVAATSFVSLAVPIELERAWLSMAWALEVPVLLVLAARLRIPVLALLARVLAVLAVVRLAANPGVFDYPIGTGIVWNWLLPGYGVPLLALAAGAWLARGEEDRTTAGLLEVGALVLAFAYAVIEIGQIYHPGEPDGTPVGLAQWGSTTVATLLLGWAALAAGQRTGRGALAGGGVALLWIGLGATMAGQGLFLNPLWAHEPVGATPLLNLLLWIYGVPAALLLAAAHEAGAGAAGLGAALPAPGTAPPTTARPVSTAAAHTGPASTLAALSAPLWRLAALALSFWLLTAEVRQLFHGTYLDTGPTPLTERWAYSAAWALFATALLVLGIARRGRLLRYASLAVMLVVVLKVFLYDTGHLTGLYRVGSLLGLGATLLLLAHLYGRFVFRESPVDVPR